MNPYLSNNYLSSDEEELKHSTVTHMPFYGGCSSHQQGPSLRRNSEQSSDLAKYINFNGAFSPTPHHHQLLLSQDEPGPRAFGFQRNLKLDFQGRTNLYDTFFNNEVPAVNSGCQQILLSPIGNDMAATPLLKQIPSPDPKGAPRPIFKVIKGRRRSTSKKHRERSPLLTDKYDESLISMTISTQVTKFINNDSTLNFTQRARTPVKVPSYI